MHVFLVLCVGYLRNISMKLKTTFFLSYHNIFFWLPFILFENLSYHSFICLYLV
jgi:hypothetical protein